jgi:hypothetical protein
MIWRVWWYIAGRWCEARRERLRHKMLAGTDTAAQFWALHAERDELKARAEKYFRRAGL